MILCTLFAIIGNPDIKRTMYDCVDNTLDMFQPPSFTNGADPVDVYVAFAINNLISISELESTVTLDFYWRLYWQDPRLNVPSMWEAINQTSARPLINDGAELREMVRNDDNPLNIWLPDVMFPDGKEVEFPPEGETITISPNGVMFWSRHTVATLMQPAFCKWVF